MHMVLYLVREQKIKQTTLWRW